MSTARSTPPPSRQRSAGHNRMKKRRREDARRRSLEVDSSCHLARGRGLGPEVGRNDREVDPVVDQPPAVLVGEDEQERLRTGRGRSGSLSTTKAATRPSGSSETSVTVMSRTSASSARGSGGAAMRVGANLAILRVDGQAPVGAPHAVFRHQPRGPRDVAGVEAGQHVARGLLDGDGGLDVGDLAKRGRDRVIAGAGTPSPSSSRIVAISSVGRGSATHSEGSTSRGFSASSGSGVPSWARTGPVTSSAATGASASARHRRISISSSPARAGGLCTDGHYSTPAAVTAPGPSVSTAHRPCRSSATSRQSEDKLTTDEPERLRLVNRAAACPESATSGRSPAR